ncbi:MAG: lactate utilization protein C, partial [Mycobacterium sp.]
MSQARAEILARIRGALADRPAVPDVAWTYGRVVGTGDLDAAERFIERVADYRARVDRVDREDSAAAIAAALRE